MSLETNANRPEEREIEELLRTYFATEIPKRLPPLPPPGSRSPAGASARPRRRLTAAEWIAYSALAATVALVLAAHFTNAPSRLVPVGASIAAGSAPEALPFDDDADSCENDGLLASVELRDLEYSVFERRDPIRTSRFVTDEGEFEQRTLVRWKVYSIYEPRTGERVQWSTPMVSVTVLPFTATAVPANR